MKGLFLNPDIYVINLERAKARKAMLEQSVPAVLRPRLKFFRAVDAKDEAELDPWKKRVSKWRTYLSIRRELSDSEIACFASHYSLWKLIAEKRICGDEGAAVVEDDIVFCPNIEAALEEIPKSGFNYVRLYAGSERRFLKFSQNFSYSSHRVWLTAGYWLNPKGAEQLLRGADVWHNEVDNYIDEFWKHGLPIVAYTPFPIRLNPEVSTNSQIYGRDRALQEEGMVQDAFFKILRNFRELRRTVAHVKLLLRHPELRHREST